MAYEDSLPNNFECFINLAREKCGAFQGRIVKKDSDLVCTICKRIITTLSDIDEGGEGSDTDPYSRSEEGDDDSGETGEVIYDSGEDIEPDWTPEETMTDDIRELFFHLRGQLSDQDDERAAPYAHYIGENYPRLVELYMTLSHHGLRFWEPNTGRRSQRAVFVICVDMLTQQHLIDYYILLELTNIHIQRARVEIRAILAFLRGEGVDEVVDYMRLYAPSLNYTDIIDQAIEWWEKVPKRNIIAPPEAKAVIWLAESALKIKGHKYTISHLAARTRISHKPLSDLRKAYHGAFVTLIL